MATLTHLAKINLNRNCKIRLQILDIWCKNVRQKCRESKKKILTGGLKGIYRVSRQSFPVFKPNFDPFRGVKSKIGDQFFSIAIVDLDFRHLFNSGCLLKNFRNFDFKKIDAI